MYINYLTFNGVTAKVESLCNDYYAKNNSKIYYNLEVSCSMKKILSFRNDEEICFRVKDKDVFDKLLDWFTSKNSIYRFHEDTIRTVKNIFTEKGFLDVYLCKYDIEYSSGIYTEEKEVEIIELKYFDWRFK